MKFGFIRDQLRDYPFGALGSFWGNRKPLGRPVAVYGRFLFPAERERATR